MKLVKWDSDFFEKKIGVVQSSDKKEIENEIQEAIKEQYDLLYFFSDEMIYQEDIDTREYQLKLVDIKQIYQATIKEKELSRAVEYIGSAQNLYPLALQAGHMSRYKTDIKFRDEDYVRLYKTWIDNSLNHKLADRIYVVLDQNQSVGFVTCKIQEGELEIGLFATDEKYRGQGVGRELWNACCNFAIENNIKKMVVATQKGNTGACAFYTKCGMYLQKTIYIYHIWINKNEYYDTF